MVAIEVFKVDMKGSNFVVLLLIIIQSIMSVDVAVVAVAVFARVVEVMLPLVEQVKVCLKQKSRAGKILMEGYAEDIKENNSFSFSEIEGLKVKSDPTVLDNCELYSTDETMEHIVIEKYYLSEHPGNVGNTYLSV